MTTIQRAPWRRAPFLLLVSSVAIGLVTHGFFGFAIRTGEQRVLAVILCSAVAGAGFVTALNFVYRPFAFDAVSRTVRIGRRTVPVETVREAWRSYQRGSNGAAYLIYRFRSTDGPSVRVLVAGRPLRGLGDIERATLADFLRLAPIPGPPQKTADTLRGAMASDILGDGTKVPVSAAVLLRELGAVGVTSVDVAVDEQAGGRAAAPAVDEAATQTDDVDALSTLRSVGYGVRVARSWFGRALGALTIALPLLAAVALVAAFLGWPVDDSLIAVVVVLALGVLALVGLVWTILADLDSRTVRRESRRWWDAADPAARARGLPAVYHHAWLGFAPGDRVLTVLAVVGGVFGLLLVLSGLISLTTDRPLVVLIAVPGVVFCALAIVFWVRHRRRRRADVLWVLEAAGPRAGIR